MTTNHWLHISIICDNRYSKLSKILMSVRFLLIVLGQVRRCLAAFYCYYYFSSMLRDVCQRKCKQPQPKFELCLPILFLLSFPHFSFHCWLCIHYWYNFVWQFCVFHSKNGNLSKSFPPNFLFVTSKLLLAVIDESIIWETYDFYIPVHCRIAKYLKKISYHWGLPQWLLENVGNCALE